MERFELATAAIREAGAVLRQSRLRSSDIAIKTGYQDLVTYWDRKTEQLLRSTFPDGNVKTPRIYELSDQGLSRYNLTMICSTFLNATVSFKFLHRYLMDSMMDENSASMMVGASKGKLLFLIFCEGLVLFLGVSILGLLLHYALYTPVFSKLNYAEGLVYRLGDYLRILAGICAIVLVCLIPFLGKYMKMSPIRGYRTRL